MINDNTTKLDFITLYENNTSSVEYVYILNNLNFSNVGEFVSYINTFSGGLGQDLIYEMLLDMLKTAAVNLRNNDINAIVRAVSRLSNEKQLHYIKTNKLHGGVITDARVLQSIITEI